MPVSSLPIVNGSSFKLDEKNCRLDSNFAESSLLRSTNGGAPEVNGPMALPHSSRSRLYSKNKLRVYIFIDQARVKWPGVDAHWQNRSRVGDIFLCNGTVVGDVSREASARGGAERAKG